MEDCGDLPHWQADRFLVLSKGIPFHFLLWAVADLGVDDRQSALRGRGIPS